jgi:hypothetical protein
VSLANEAYEDDFVERAEELEHFIGLMKHHFDIPNFVSEKQEDDFKHLLIEKRRSLIREYKTNELVIAAEKLKKALKKC